MCGIGMARHRGVSPESEPSSCSYTSASDGSPSCSTTASPQSSRSPRGQDQEPSSVRAPCFSPRMLSHPTQRSLVKNPLASSKDPEDIRIELCDVDLWRTFNTNVTNEMIITKSGRKLFPIVKVKVTGMEVQGMYSISMDFVQQGSQRWKYTEGGWSPAGKAEPQPLPATYLHNKSPHYGHFWMKEPVDFAKIKVSNKKSDDKIWLNSLHLYEPRIRICKIDPAAKNGETVVAEKSLPSCAFMAVTSYQNDSITRLKIGHNPFAKGFAAARDMKERRMNGFDEMEAISPGPTQHTSGSMYHPPNDVMQYANGQSPFIQFPPLSPWQNAAAAMYDGTLSTSDAPRAPQSPMVPAQSYTVPLSDTILPFPAAPSHHNDLDLSTSFYNSGHRPAAMVIKTEKGYRHHTAPYDMSASGLFHRRAVSRTNETYSSTVSGNYSHTDHSPITSSAGMYNSSMTTMPYYHQYQPGLYNGFFQSDPGWNFGRYTGPYPIDKQRSTASMLEGQQGASSMITPLSPQDSSPASTDSAASNTFYF